MRPDIDQPTTFPWNASIAAARLGRPSPVPMQPIHPYCGDRKVLKGYNDLRTTHPGIAAMWHPRMNRRLKPTGAQAVSRKPAWWRGECGHVYQMAVRDRVGSSRATARTVRGGRGPRGR